MSSASNTPANAPNNRGKAAKRPLTDSSDWHPCQNPAIQRPVRPRVDADHNPPANDQKDDVAQAAPPAGNDDVVMVADAPHNQPNPPAAQPAQANEHWSRWDDDRFVDWARTVEDPLPDRDDHQSTAAILRTRVPVLEITRLLRTLATPIPTGDIQPTGHQYEMVIWNMSPAKWGAIRLWLPDSGVKSPENEPAQLVPPKDYINYDDVSIAIKIAADGANGPMTPSEFLLGLTGVGNLPQPLRIQRIYMRSGGRTKSIRLVFRDQRERNLWCSKKKVMVYGKPCTITKFTTPTPILKPANPQPRRRNDAQNSTAPSKA